MSPKDPKYIQNDPIWAQIGLNELQWKNLNNLKRA